MATTPTPRSYSQILGDCVDAFLSRYGLRTLKVGSPVLSILESTAQSQFRNSADIFTLLESLSLDSASGIALDRLGADDGVSRIPQNSASGPVTISDTSFTKISSKVFQGSPAPIIGSTAINVVDASTFPASGSVYLGRSTNQYEGPIAYSSKTDNGTYWTLALSTATLRFHNQGESVVVAQGGDREIAAGTLVKTPQGNTSSSVQFKLVFKATIPDGETSIANVLVVAIKPGLSGNVAAGSINSITAFTNAAVTNPLPYTNGTATEDDETFRERIRQARQTKQKGTALAISTNAVGVTATDENKRVLSSSVVTREGYPTTLYIDDGTGYEMQAGGVAIESLVDQAMGGERYFKVSQRPIAKAYVQTTLSAPYTLAAGQKLAFAIDNVSTEHTFDSDEFRNITNATAYEVVASINADPALDWQARTAANGTQVIVTAKADRNESIQNTAIVNGEEANEFLGFPVGRVDTMRLYRDDRLLFKDGRTASIASNTTSLWSTLTGDQTLFITVDGVDLAFDNVQFAKFTDQDFIDAETGYTTLGNNSAEAWAAVFNMRIPGITATVESGLVVITSNRGHLSRASVEITSGTLVAGLMFVATESVGASSDYTLNRNTGELALSSPLTVGQKLSTGSSQTRAFINTAALTTLTLASQAQLWLALDAGATLVSTGLTSATSLTFTGSAKAWGFRVRCTAGSAIFGNVAPGDWVVFWDAAVALAGAYRVAAVDAGGTWFEIEKATTYAAVVIPTQVGIQFCRTTTADQLQALTIASGTNYTATSLATALDATVDGAYASTYRTNILRLRTNTFSDVNGDVALVAANTDAQLIGLPRSNAVENLTGHMASIESGNSEIGTPGFDSVRINAVTSQTNIDIETESTLAPSTGALLWALRANDDGLTSADTRYSSQYGFRTTLKDTTANAGFWTTNLREGPAETWLYRDRLLIANPYMFASDDEFSVLVDGDTTLKRYSIPMWRSVTPTTSTYGASNDFVDADNANASLAVGFGLSYDFNDFAVHMAARAKTDSADVNKAVLWRYFRLGPDGNNARIQYQNPTGPDEAVSITVDNTTTSTIDLGVQLASGAARTGYSLRTTSHIGHAITALSSGMASVTYMIGFTIVSAGRTANVTALQLTLPAGVTDHGIPVGALIYVNSVDPNFSSGIKSVTAVDPITVFYSEIAADQPGTGAVGTMSFDIQDATLSGGAVVVGDFFKLDTPFTATTGDHAMYMATAANQSWTGKIPWTGGTSGVVSWQQINDLSKFEIFSNPSQTVGAIVTAIQALDPAPMVMPTLISSGTGTVVKSTDETDTSYQSYTALTDGINYVKTTTAPGSIVGNYTLVFKDAITAALATNSDWTNEEIRLVPRTASNVAEWFNTLAVSGLSSVAEAVVSSNSKYVQLSSLTAGSGGSLQVQGGGANFVTASVVGSASASPSGCIANVPYNNTQGLFGGCYVSIDNENVMPKASVFASGTNLTSIATDGTFTFNGGGTPVITKRSSAVNVVLKFERQGQFIAISDTALGTNSPNIASVVEGDYIWLAASAAPTGATQAAAGNLGLYRIVRRNDGYTAGGTVWIENINFVEQNLGECDVVFLAPNSVLPGDTIQISTSLWGIENLGSWTVLTVGGATAFSSAFTFKVDVSTKALTAVGAVGALGSGNANLVQCIEGTPMRLVKKILSISENGDDRNLADVKFDSGQLSSSINATAGSVMTVLDKLDFDMGIAKGIDGYQYNTGLIREVNRVEYGDPSDSATYPGVVAAGANVNIEGAPIKRITVSIALRVRSGSPTTDISNSFKSAVAAVINSKGVGQAIALSDITGIKIPGVISVIMINPVSAVGSDLISVQPYEKPRVLDLDTDILISFVGE